MSEDFVIPGAEDRTVVMGQTGSGKTIFGAWLLSLQNMEKRPWVAMDFKEEELWDRVGSPPMRPLRLNQMPGKRGLYRLPVYPGQEEQLEDWLWKVWRRGNIGLFCDEVTLIPKWNAFKAVLRQGRSRLIPVIACTQRPFDCPREVFTESRVKVIFQLDDEEDYKRVKQFTGRSNIDKPLPRHCAYWYDSQRRALLTLKPAPAPATIARDIKMAAPTSWAWG